MARAYCLYMHIYLMQLYYATTIWKALSASVRQSTSTYHRSGLINITRPSQTKKDDLLFLFLSRTDDGLPVKLKGWKPVASCLKPKNSARYCRTIDDCSQDMWKGYCYNGYDLGTVVFYRKATDYEPQYYFMDITAYYGEPAWAILTAVEGADIVSENPVRNVATMSCDKTNHSIFPSVHAEKNDLLLLSLVYDDRATDEHFPAPNGTRLESYTNGRDEAGFLYSKELAMEGETGIFNLTTFGIKYRCKDAMISLVVKRNMKKLNLLDWMQHLITP